MSAKQRFITHLGALVWDALVNTEASNLQITHSEFTRERNPEKKLAASINILASTLLHNVVKKHIDLSGSKQASSFAIQNILNGDWNAVRLLIVRQKLSPNSVIGQSGVELFDKYRTEDHMSADPGNDVFLAADSTLLMLCSVLGNLDLVNLLLASGAQSRLHDSNGLSASDYVAMTAKSKKEAISKQLAHAGDRLSFSDIDWKTSGLIGEGSFTSASRACLHNGTQVAIKQIIKHTSLSIMTKQMLNLIMAEVSALEKLRHQNIVSCLGTIVWSENLPPGMVAHPIILLEYVNGGTLANALADPNRLREVHCRVHLLEQVAEALEYMHSFNPPMVHRDLKPANILLSGNNDEIAKVTDFCLSRVQSGTHFSTTHTQAGTINYLAPELWREQSGTHKVDVYCFGILMWATVTRDEPWKNLTEMQIKINMVDKKHRPDATCFQQEFLQSLYTSCVCESPYERPSFEQIRTAFKQKEIKCLTMMHHAKAFSFRLLNSCIKERVPSISRRSTRGTAYLSGLANVKIPESLQTALVKVPCKGLGLSVELCVCKMSNLIREAGERLSLREASAICLYTAPGCFYKQLNQVLQSQDRGAIIPYFPYLRLLFQALDKLPVYTGPVWRGVKADLASTHPVGTHTSWPAFSSVALDMQTLDNEMFTHNTALFHIKEAVGIDITR